MPEGYDSREAAAEAALKEAMGLVERYEYAGVVYQKDDKFFYTPPQTSKRGHNVEVKVRYPKGAKLTALYHTHPVGRDSQKFSQVDIEVARQLGIPYYMGNMRNNNLLTFDPDKTRVRKNKLDRSLYSEGNPLAIPPAPPPPDASVNDLIAHQQKLAVISRRERIRQPGGDQQPTITPEEEK